MSFDLSLYSKYRSELMGVSALAIIICHANVANVALSHVLSSIFTLGNVGVDIFLFVSGMGMFFSLNKKTALSTYNQHSEYKQITQMGGGNSLVLWYRKRFIRILVPYFVITTPWWIYYSLTRDIGIGGFMLHLSTLGFWFEHYGAWYVALLIPLYLLTPYMAFTIDKSPFRLFLVAALSVIVFVLCGVKFTISGDTWICNVVHNAQWAFGRVPSFIIGYGIGPWVLSRKRVSLPLLFLLPLCLWAAMKYMPIVNTWQRYWLMVIPFMTIVVLMLERIKSNFVNRSLLFMGTISLESYLANVFVMYALNELDYSKFGILWNGNYLYYLLVIILGTLIAVIANKLSAVIINKSQKNF